MVGISLQQRATGSHNISGLLWQNVCYRGPLIFFSGDYKIIDTVNVLIMPVEKVGFKKTVLKVFNSYTAEASAKGGQLG